MYNDRLLSAKNLDATLEQIESAEPVQIADTVAQKRAAQILAEMLGIVCYQEYIECGNQMVDPFCK